MNRNDCSTRAGICTPCRSVQACDDYEEKIDDYSKILSREEVLEYLEETKLAWVRCDNKYNNKCKFIGKDFWAGDEAFLYRIALRHYSDRNFKRALPIATKAANNNYPRAAHLLGVYHDPNFDDGSKNKNMREAFEWYSIAASQKWVRSMISVAQAYRHGRGVQKNAQRFYQMMLAALEVNDPAQKKEFPNVYFLLGQAHEYGIGTTVNNNKAFEYYLDSARMGDAEAMYNVGVFYNKARGVEKDICKAVYWYQKSHDGGFVAATHNLANRYWGGQCVERDLFKAVMLYEQAAKSGYELSQKMLGEQAELVEHIDSIFEAAEGLLKAANILDVYKATSCGYLLGASDYELNALGDISGSLPKSAGDKLLRLSKSDSFREKMSSNFQFVQDSLQDLKSKNMSPSDVCKYSHLVVSELYEAAKQNWAD